MAVIAAAAAASSLGFASGSFGALALGFGGTLLDSFLLFPLLNRGQPDIEGPRLEDLSVQGTAEGSPARWLLGPACRSAGTVIWSTDLVETTTRTDVGGKGGGGATQTTYSYSLSCAVHVCDTRNLDGGVIDDILKVYANTKEIYDDNGGSPVDDARYESLTIYKGDQTAADSIIDATDPGNVPAYKDAAYIVIEDLQLSPFGNRMPNFEIVTRVQASLDIADAIGLICDRAGLSSSQYDTSGVTGTMQGIMTVGEQEMGKVLEYVMLAYNVTVFESNGQLVFIDREQTTTLDIDEDLLGAVEEGQGAESVPYPFSRSDNYDEVLSKRASVTFIDPDCDYEQSTRTAVKTNAVGARMNRVNLPMTLDPDDASEIAYRTLWSEWGVREEVEGFLPPSMIHIEAGDLLTIEDDGVEELIRVASVERGDNFLVRFRGRIEEPDIYTQYGITEDRSCIAADTPAEVGTEAFVIVTDHLLTQRVNDYDGEGFYAAFATTDPDDSTWGVLQSSLNDATFSTVYFRASGGQTVRPQARMGKLLTALAAAGDGVKHGAWWDKETTVDIEVFDSGWVPSSMDDEDVLNGANHIVLVTDAGVPEMIAFADVSSIGTNQYRLSRLLRGLRGTDIYESSWAINSIFVAAEDLDGLGDNFDRYWDIDRVSGVRPREGVEEDLYWKYFPSITGGAAISSKNVPTNLGTLKPYPATDVRVYRDGSSNATIAFRRVTRYYHSLFSALTQAPVPPGMNTLQFVVEIWNPGDTEVVRTLTVSRSSDAVTPALAGVIDQSNFEAAGMFAVNYTAAQQTTDGYTPGDPINFRIYQSTFRAYAPRGHARVLSM